MSGRRRHRNVPLVVVMCGFGLTACFVSAVDYQRDAEAYINGTVAEELDISFAQVECEPPVDRNIGTRFECTALDAANGTWVFDNEITAENQFEVKVFSRP